LPNELKSSGERLTDRLNLREKLSNKNNMSDEALKKLDLLLEKNEKMEQDLKDIKEYIPCTDRVKNMEYCRLRKISRRTLDNWFDDGCPREDKEHVSIKAVDEFKRNTSTRKKK
jgi:hypothetical protein